MKCFVCGSEMKDYLKKTIEPEPFERDYVRCERCGLVLCKTLYEMSDSEWQKMNEGHKEYQGSDENPVDPNWLFRLHCQAKLFAGLAAHDIWQPGMHFVDYGCGDGKLADYVQNELTALRGGNGSSNMTNTCGLKDPVII